MGDFFVQKKQYIQLGVIIGGTYLGMKYISPLVSPFLIAVLIVIFLFPRLERVKRRFHIRKSFLAVGILLAAGFILGGVLWLAGSFLCDKISLCLQQTSQLKKYCCCLLRDACLNMESSFGMDASAIEKFVMENLELVGGRLQKEWMPSIMGESLIYVRNLAAIVGFLMVLLIGTVLLAKDYEIITNALQKADGIQGVIEVGKKVVSYIATFLRAQVIILTCISVVSAVILGLGGIRGGVIIGLITGLMDMLPFIGTGIILVLLSIFQALGGYYGKAFLCLGLYLVCALLREFLEPKLIDDKVGILPIGILLSVYAGIRLFGIVGIIKGPLALVIICETYRYLRQTQPLS